MLWILFALIYAWIIHYRRRGTSVEFESMVEISRCGQDSRENVIFDTAWLVRDRYAGKLSLRQRLDKPIKSRFIRGIQPWISYCELFEKISIVRMFRSGIWHSWDISICLHFVLGGSDVTLEYTDCCFSKGGIQKQGDSCAAVFSKDRNCQYLR